MTPHRGAIPEDAGPRKGLKFTPVGWETMGGFKQGSAAPGRDDNVDSWLWLQGREWTVGGRWLGDTVKRLLG